MATSLSTYAFLSKIMIPWGPIQAHAQPKRHLDRFSHFCTAQRSSLYFTTRRPFPSKSPLPMGDLIDPHLIHGSSNWAHHNPNGISIGSAVFVGLTSVTDRPTDRPRYSVLRPLLQRTLRPASLFFSAPCDMSLM